MQCLSMQIEGRPFRAYVPDATQRSYYHGNRPAIVIFPGGGYEFTYEGEAEPIALRFCAAGIVSFILDYSCGDHRNCLFPKPLKEALLSIRYVREHAAEYGINPHNIAACGFSAGGHLCACVGTLWNKSVARDFVGEDPYLCRPDKLILSYAVLRSTMPTHMGSIQTLWGTETPTEEQERTVDVIGNADAETPPSFLWATSSDDAVPICSSLEFANRLAGLEIPFEIHIWPHGHHGLCLGNQVTEARPFGQNDLIVGWPEDAIRFLYDEKLTRS